MRKAERACNDNDFLAEVLGKCDELYLAFNTGDFPYIIPVNFVHSGKALYFHCATEGLKLDLLRQDSRVAFSCATDVVIDVKKSTTYYRSVCGKGHAVLVEDAQEKNQALHLIAQRYASLCPHPTPPSMLERVALVRIDITELTGKSNLPAK